MRRSILCLLLFAFFACKKSTYNEQPGNPEDLIEGNWKLIQYYRDNSDGSGQWLPVDTANVQTVEFSPGGKFSHNKNFVIQETIDRFEFMKPNEILLYSSHASDSAKYFYKQDQYDQLIFNPVCMEFSCMRKFQRLQ